jgi:predicted ATPase
MITRFYVDNYKCLQNFEYKPQQFELIVGANGTGKTTVFEALDKLRRFVVSQIDAKEIFTSDSATRWNSRPEQIFELDYIVGGREFQYRLEINLFSSFRVEKEIVKEANKVILETAWERREPDKLRHANALDDDFDDSDPFADEHDGEVRTASGEYFGLERSLANPNQSVFSYTYGYLRHALAQSHFFKINPAIMISRVGKAEPRPANDLHNFSSYYLYLLQQKQGLMFDMIPHLREAITNFDSFAVEEDFEEGRRDLRVVFKAVQSRRQNLQRSIAGPLKYSFEELSDGQRALVALYTLLFCTLEEGTTLVIDEPENYIALRELQPWLMLLQERLEEHGGQVILISHHPEFINALAPSHTTVFERESGGPVRVKPFDTKLAESLAPAETIARGWENE